MKTKVGRLMWDTVLAFDDGKELALRSGDVLDIDASDPDAIVGFVGHRVAVLPRGCCIVVGPDELTRADWAKLERSRRARQKAIRAFFVRMWNLCESFEQAAAAIAKPLPAIIRKAAMLRRLGYHLKWQPDEPRFPFGIEASNN
jgi:hypothetical protein